MIGFRKYVYESANAKTTLEGLKKFLPLVNDKYKAHIEQNISVLMKASEEKEIYNARFIDASKTVLNFINRAYSVLEKTLTDYRKNNRDASDKIPYSIYTLSDIKKAVKDTAKISDLPSQIKVFLDAIKDIPELFAIIKGYVKKGKEPKQADPNRPAAFVKPSTSFDSSKAAAKFMKEASETFEKELHENIIKQVMSSYDKLKEYEGKSPFEIPKDTSLRSIATTVFKTTTKGGKQVLEFTPGHEDRLKKLVDDNVRDIVDGFVGKSASKLALILQKKGMPKSHEIVRTNIRNGMVENVMKFAFEDGSSFTMESSVVYKYSQMGKLFFQYPTRFKNVRLADGTMMKMPSEKKMIEDF